MRQRTRTPVIVVAGLAAAPPTEVPRAGRCGLVYSGVSMSGAPTPTPCATADELLLTLWTPHPPCRPGSTWGADPTPSCAPANQPIAIVGRGRSVAAQPLRRQSAPSARQRHQPSLTRWRQARRCHHADRRGSISTTSPTCWSARPPPSWSHDRPADHRRRCGRRCTTSCVNWRGRRQVPTAASTGRWPTRSGGCVTLTDPARSAPDAARSSADGHAQSFDFLATDEPARSDATCFGAGIRSCPNAGRCTPGMAPMIVTTGGTTAATARGRRVRRRFVAWGAGEACDRRRAPPERRERCHDVAVRQHRPGHRGALWHGRSPRGVWRRSPVTPGVRHGASRRSIPGVRTPLTPTTVVGSRSV